MIRSVIASTGSFLPAQIVTNKDLEAQMDTTDEWIQQRTGIKQRHIVVEGETTSQLAIRAAQDALKNGGFTGSDIDTVIVATSTPDLTFPSVAVKVQAALDMPQGAAFDLQAVCSGFVYGLSVADSMIRTGSAKRVLLIGAETMSSVLDWSDRTTSVLFGDGAGAVILEADSSGKGTKDDRGILSTHLHADGRLSEILKTTGGTSSTRTSGHIYMEGKEVFRHAVQFMADVVNEAIAANNITPAEIDWLVPHQANIRIIEGTAKKLDMGMDRVVVTVDRHGNTSAASIPLALHDAVSKGQIRRNQLLLLEALGSGLTWGSALIRF